DARKKQRATTSLRRAAPGARVPRTRNPRKNSLCREPTRGHLAPRSSRNLPHLVGGTTRWTGRSPTDTTTNFRRVHDLLREPGPTSGVNSVRAVATHGPSAVTIRGCRTWCGKRKNAAVPPRRKSPGTRTGTAGATRSEARRVG